MTEENLNAWLKFVIGICFCMILMMMASLSMYSVVFVTQPMSGMAPADKQFFLLLSDMSKYILGALATLIAVKGKDQFVPPSLSTAKEREDAMKPTPPTTPPPSAPAPAPAPMSKRVEPTIEPVAAAAPVVLGFNGKPAPPPAPQPEIE
jgi:hypothetical protein